MAEESDMLAEFKGKDVVIVFSHSLGGATGEDSRSGDTFKGKMLDYDKDFVKVSEDYGSIGNRVLVINRKYMIKVRLLGVAEG